MMKKSEVEHQLKLNIIHAKDIVCELKKDIGFLEDSIDRGIIPYWLRDMENRVANLRLLAHEKNVLNMVLNGK